MIQTLSVLCLEHIILIYLEPLTCHNPLKAASHSSQNDRSWQVEESWWQNWRTGKLGPKLVHYGPILPSGEHTKSYWKWPLKSWIFPIKMVDLSIAMLVHQRVCPILCPILSIESRTDLHHQLVASVESKFPSCKLQCMKGGPTN